MNDVIVYKPTAGCSIDRAAEESLQIAEKNVDKKVTFRFNGIDVIVNYWNTVETIVNQFNTLQEAKIASYRSSPLYRKVQEEQRIKIKALQDKVDYLLEHLRFTKGNELALINWLGEFAAIADNMLLVYNKSKLAAQLISFGYTDNAFLGLPKESYNNKTILAGWLVGQAINQLKLGMPPHPMLSSWCDKYQEL